MNKTHKIGLFLLLGALIALPLSINASEKPIEPVVFSTLQDVQWVRKCIDQYPEILWLADAQVRKTEEGQATVKGAYSEQLFRQKYTEFERAIMTMRCLRLVLDGSEKAYNEFSASQPHESRLSRSSFEKLHAQGMELLNSKYEGMTKQEMTQAMEAALVLGDMGKSEKARALFKPFGVTAPDHDDFHGEAMQVLLKNPTLCPTFNRLPPAAQKLLAQTANLAHFGHITHLEGGPDMFSVLKQSGLAFSSPTALSFDLFVHTCDVAGALGHVDNHSSIVYTEPTHLAMQGMIEACKVLSNPQKTEEDAYDEYLALRAHWLGLNAQDQSERALVRMGAMLRLFTPEEGRILKQAFLKLDPQTQAQITEQLDGSQKLGRTPTYMPAVLVNLSNNQKLGATREERISQAVRLGLPFIARALEKHRQSAHSTVVLNFNLAAGIAKTHPHELNQECSIDQEGNVRLSNY